MKYPMLKRPTTYLTLLGAGMSFLLGNISYSNAATDEYAMKVLHVGKPGLISHLPGGYKSLHGTAGIIKMLAAGDKVKLTKEGFFAGTPSRVASKEEVISIAKKADTNGDEVITGKEITDFIKRGY